MSEAIEHLKKKGAAYWMLSFLSIYMFYFKGFSRPLFWSGFLLGWDPWFKDSLGHSIFRRFILFYSYWVVSKFSFCPSVVERRQIWKHPSWPDIDGREDGESDTLFSCCASRSVSRVQGSMVFSKRVISPSTRIIPVKNWDVQSCNWGYWSQSWFMMLHIPSVNALCLVMERAFAVLLQK